MKSEHRHELKTNELAKWLTNFPQWAKENRTTIIYVSALVITVAGLYFWKVYEKNVVSVRERLNLTNLITQLSQSKPQILQAQAQGFDSSYNLLPIADKLAAAAQNTKNNQMAALALIKRAQALRMELHYRLEAAGEREIKAQIDTAKASYTEAINLLSNADSQTPIENRKFKNPSLIATAKFGLGLCEEELGNFEKAEQIYRDIAENSSFESTTALVQAEQRLNTMADYRQKVVFKQSPIKPEVKSTSAEPVQPQIKLQAPDINSVP